MDLIRSFANDDFHKNHRLVTEHAFRDYFGHSLKAEEILFLIRRANPSYAFDRFIKGRNCLKYCYTNETITFKEKYKTTKKRKYRKWLYMTLYFSCATPATFIFSGLPYDLLERELTKIHGVIYLFMGLFIVYVLLALDTHSNIKIAEDFMKEVEQEKTRTGRE